MKRTHGFVLARNTKNVLAKYHESLFAHESHETLQALRSAFTFLDPASYRGISRDVLIPYPSLDPKILEAFADSDIDMETEQHARKRFREIIGEAPEEDDDDDGDILIKLTDAKEVYQRLDTPEEFEIIELSREPFALQSESLGFDIGYWGGDHFSLICGSIIMPMWHPPDPEDFQELSTVLRCLNRHCLFPTRHDVMPFYEYYTTRSWAENESVAGEFCVIQIGLPQ